LLNEVPPPVVIEEVRTDEQVLYGDGVGPQVQGPEAKIKSPPSKADFDRVRIEPNRRRVIKIRYTANTLAAPERVTFHYRLRNYDKDWREVGQERVAFYNNLRPGNYQFEVKARNHHGVW